MGCGSSSTNSPKKTSSVFLASKSGLVAPITGDQEIQARIRSNKVMVNKIRANQGNLNLPEMDTQKSIHPQAKKGNPKHTFKQDTIQNQLNLRISQNLNLGNLKSEEVKKYQVINFKNQEDQSTSRQSLIQEQESSSIDTKNSLLSLEDYSENNPARSSTQKQISSTTSIDSMESSFYLICPKSIFKKKDQTRVRRCNSDNLRKRRREVKSDHFIVLEKIAGLAEY